jgi:hypothetical protein
MKMLCLLFGVLIATSVVKAEPCSDNERMEGEKLFRVFAKGGMYSSAAVGDPSFQGYVFRSGEVESRADAPTLNLYGYSLNCSRLCEGEAISMQDFREVKHKERQCELRTPVIRFRMKVLDSSHILKDREGYFAFRVYETEGRRMGLKASILGQPYLRPSE